MVKKNAGKTRHNSVSETKISDQKKYRVKILSMVNEKSNNKSQYLLFYLIKLFERQQFKPLSKDEILRTIKNKYVNDPTYFMTINNEKFKTKQSLCSTLVRIFNKICSKKNNLYKFNEKATLKYLKKSLNTEDNLSRTPYKLYNRKNEIKKENKTDEEEIKIKQEDINIKEEKEDNLDNVKNIKEEKSDNEYKDNIENMSIEIEEENCEKNLFELFNRKKLYDDFYFYLAEEGQFEQLQEEIEKFMEKYKNNEIVEMNKLKIMGIMGKIKNVKLLLDDLYNNKKEYENLSTELEQKKNWIKLFIEIFYVNIKTIKNMLNHANLYDLISEAKHLYNEDKRRQNEIFDQIIKKIEEIRNVVMKSDKIKNDIIKEIESISEFFKKNNINIENINEFYELEKNLVNGKYSFIIREDISEDIIEKYNKYINMFEDNLDLTEN